MPPAAASAADAAPGGCASPSSCSSRCASLALAPPAARPTPRPSEGGITGDVRRYQEMATADGTAYADFQVEYPPITYAAIQFLAGPDLARSHRRRRHLAVPVRPRHRRASCWRVWGTRAVGRLPAARPARSSCGRSSTPASTCSRCCWPSAGWRSSGAARSSLGAAGLAAAVLTKIWPFVLAPVLVVERRWRAVAAFVVTGLVLGGAWIAVAGVDGVRQVVSFRDATGWQVESLPGVLWHLRDPSRIKFESGAFRTGIMPLWARPAADPAQPRRRRRGLVAGRPAPPRGRRRPRRSTAGRPLASVLAMLLFAPILSPQYVVWFLPFAAITAARGDRLVGGLTFAVTASPPSATRSSSRPSEGGGGRSCRCSSATWSWSRSSSWRCSPSPATATALAGCRGPHVAPDRAPSR